ncbi:hypothetical protein [Desnuesiella massiliensis]|uniref:hypothetical protein n=1 Tax=Desnuesiella massiliensis TaxID=1650662 RepID=UPI0006E3A979|nr:hypothetical protein [Desnuesiella massiliensis]
MKKNKIITLLAAVTISIVLLSACSKGNSSANDNAYKSINSIIKENRDKVGFHAEMSHWGLSLQGEEKFEWTKDPSSNEADFAMVILADPFIKAGLDTNKLDSKEIIFKKASKEGNMENSNLLIRPLNISDKRQNSDGAEDAIRRLFKMDKTNIKGEDNYYKLDLGSSFEVKWKYQEEDKSAEVIFYIDPEPLFKAGLDRNNMDETGWSIEKSAGMEKLSKKYIIKK